MSATTPFSLSSVVAYIALLSQNAWKLYFSFLCTGLVGKQMDSHIFTLKQGETAVSYQVTQLTGHNQYSSEYGAFDP